MPPPNSIMHGMYGCFSFSPCLAKKYCRTWTEDRTMIGSTHATTYGKLQIATTGERPVRVLHAEVVTVERNVTLRRFQMRGMKSAVLLQVRHHTLSRVDTVEEELKLLH